MEPMGPISVDKEYPGIEFFPPDGTINPKENEGEVLVKWKKVGDRYTLVELDGKPLAPYKIPLSKEEVEGKKEKIRAMDAFAEIDQLANLYPQ